MDGSVFFNTRPLNGTFYSPDSGAGSSAPASASGLEQEIDDFLKAIDAQISRVQRNREIKPPEKKILFWLSKQLKGTARPQDLEQVFRSWNVGTHARVRVHTGGGSGWSDVPRDYWRSRAYWRAKLALMLINDVQKPEDAQILTRAPFELKIPPTTDLNQLRLSLYGALAGKQYLDQARDPLLWGQYYFQQALLAQKMGQDPSAIFAKAAAKFNQVINNPDSTQSQIKWRLWNRRRDAKALYLSENKPVALIRNAQILLITAGSDQSKLASARRILLSAQDQINQGIKFACRRQRACIKERLLAQRLQMLEIDTFLAEIAVRTKQHATAQPLLQNILAWKRAYDKKVALSNTPRWLRQINAGAHFWTAKSLMMQAKRNKGMLETAAQHLEAALPDLEGTVKDDALLSMGENLARRAFILRESGVKSWPVLFASAKKYLEKVLNSPDKSTLAQANLWQARILIIEAGQEPDKTQRDQILQQAQQYVQWAFVRDTANNLVLKEEVLASAYQTYGELLVAQKHFGVAEQVLTLALKLDPKNFYAAAGLADVLSWNGKYSDAIPIYKYVIQHETKGSSLSRRAKLGLAEARMRQGSSYALSSITQLEAAAKEIFKLEAPDSPLISRALQGLIEAYQTQKSKQPRIIYMAKILLGLNLSSHLPETEKSELRLMLARVKPASLRDEFKAELYLRTAECLLWDKKFNQALEVIENLPAPIQQLFSISLRSKPELRVMFDLVKAEIRMRKTKKAQPFLDFLSQKYNPIQIVLQARDPNLAARIILGQIEAYSLEKKWDKVVDSIQNPIIPLATLRNLFGSRVLAFEEFSLELDLSLVTAYIGKKDYLRAVNKLKAILAASKNFKQKAKACIELGNIYSYEWPGKNFWTSRQMYKQAIKLLRGKEEALLRARAYLGLGEIHRFGHRKIQNYEESISNYNQALKELRSLTYESEETNYLAAKTYLGMALLEHQEDHPGDAYRLFIEAKSKRGELREAPDELDAQINIARNEIPDPHIEASYQRQSELSRNILGEVYEAEESRIRLGLNVPVPRTTGQVTLRVEGLLDQRDDQQRASNSLVTSLYAGIRINPDFRFITNSKIRNLIGNRHLTLDFMARIPGTHRVSSSDPTAPKPLSFRRPDLRLSASYWSKYVTASIAWNKDLLDDRLDSTYANAMLNLAFSETLKALTKYLQIQIGPEVNLFNFAFLMNNSTSFREKKTLALAINMQTDLANFIKVLSHNRVKLRLSGSLPLIEYEHEPGQDPEWLDARNGAMFKGSASVDVNLGRLGVLSLIAQGNYQRAARYFYKSWMLGLFWEINIFPDY